jgi:SpoVK/Ycf46/Vps4 family AAA+-type ATPase
MRRLFSNHILGKELFVAETAGLNLHAYRQLLKQPDITTKDVTHQIEEYVQGQLGDDVVEFKQPEHNLDDVIGFSQIKELIRNEIIPRANGPVDEALAGMVVCGPIGSGKTFIMEAMAAEIGMPVLILKNLRSQWFGQTDVIFERLKRTLEALGKVCILVDEADTVFGSVEQEQHSTEKRLTGKVQGMMSDPKFKGKILWILITARVHLLPPDIRRPGRAGDLIIPVLDPYDKDRQDFVNWTLRGMTLTFDAYPVVFENTEHFTTVDFSLLRTSIKIRKPQHREDLISIIEDIIPSDIDGTRKTQIFQALLNCTRKSLIPKNYIVGDDVNESRKKWKYNLINLLQK